MKYSILEVAGGIGKSIMATAIVENIKEKHPDRNVIVITAYPEVFIGNPSVYRVFKFGNTPYFYNDYVKDKDTMFFCEEPYRSEGYIKQNKHLIESWCESIRVDYIHTTGKLYLNPREIEFVLNKLNFQKPILIFQPFGGDANGKLKYSWNRDIPFQQAQAIANVLSEKYTVIQPCNDKQFALLNAMQITWPLREVFALINHAKKIVSIDSFTQHCAAAFNKSATVCWITNSPNVFGYDLHNNIFPNNEALNEIENTKIDGYFTEYDFTGNRLHDFNFSTSNVFNITQIIESIGE
jgi:hypothetical protein